ncbi:MAG: MATE family efflux transporter [Paracoccaceae bacterium]
MSGPAAAAGVTHARVLRIALPIVAANASVPILGLVDTGVVGQMGEAAPIGAVGIGAVILSAVYWVFGFLRMGTTGLAGQALGAGDGAELRAVLSRALLIGAAGGLAIVALQVPVTALALALSPASAEVEVLARDYMAIRVWSAPAAVSLYAVTGWLIAQERTREVLLLQLAMNGLNVALSVIFVLGLSWGVPGVAWGTFAAEWAGLGLGLYLCRDWLTGGAWRDRARVLDRARLVRMARVNGDILLRSLMLQAIFLSFLFVASGLGDVRLAANQVLVQFLQLTAHALDGFAFAVEALVGQAVGARAVATLRHAIRIASLWALGIAAALSAAFLALGGLLIDVLSTSPEVRTTARTYLPWAALTPLTGLASWMLDGVFIGATRTRDMRDMMAVSLAVYVAAALVLVPAFGNHGLWAAMHVSFAARAVTLGWRYPALERGIGR